MSLNAFKASRRSIETHNELEWYIENYLPSLRKNSKGGPQINLTIGDPNKYNDFKPKESVLDSASDNSHLANYEISKVKNDEIRKFLADRYNKYSMKKIDQDCIFFNYGCTMALYLGISSICERGDTIILPDTGFPYSNVLSQVIGLNICFYTLQKDSDWEIDLVDLKKSLEKYKSTVKAIVINNPCNPCANVFSEVHVKNVLALIEQYDVALVSDDIYEGMVFPGTPYARFIEYTDKIPIFLCSGISKNFLVPGWRCGWVALFVPDDLKAKFYPKMRMFETSISKTQSITAYSLIQMYYGYQKFYEEKVEELFDRYKILERELNDVKGITMIPPHGTFYITFIINPDCFENIKSSIDFCTGLYTDSNIQVLPGECFGGKLFMRVVTCSDENLLVEFSKRVREFCSKNLKKI